MSAAANCLPRATVVERLRARFGDHDEATLFKLAYRNGHGPEGLTGEEDGIVKRDVASPYTPPYVLNAIG